MEQVRDVLLRGVANIIPNRDELEKVLQKDKKLNIYFGVDPTATHIHLGHAVGLRKLQAFSEMGHSVTLLIGDFTALIGDTSDKDTERPVLTKEQIQQNFQTYKKQAEKILDFSKVSVKYNSEWLSKLTFEEIVKLTQHYSVGDFVGRELIRKRLSDNKRVGLHEFLYPVMQGYDSYFMDTDIQIGGTDQTFNMQAGRTLIKDLRDKESFVLATGFLTGTDGRKMSKSWGNAIWLDDTPADMYAKAMAINDELLPEYFLLATNLSLLDVEKIEEELKRGSHPMEMKKKLAHLIVSELHSETAAESAAEEFRNRVQEGRLPDEVPTLSFSVSDNLTVEEALVKLELASSKSEAKRLVEQGGVSLDDEKLSDPNTVFSPQNDSILKIGKRKVVKLQTA